MNEIDQMACAFWGKEIDEEWYATPQGKEINWFDMIGHAIENAQYVKRDCKVIPYTFISRVDGQEVSTTVTTVPWNNVCVWLIKDNTSVNFKREKWFEIVQYATTYLKPYLEFCKHLEEQGIVAEALGW